MSRSPSAGMSLEIQQLLDQCSFSAAELDVDAGPASEDRPSRTSSRVEQVTDDSRAAGPTAIFVLTEIGRPYLRSALEKKPAAILAGREAAAELLALRDELAPGTLLLLAADLLFAQGRIASKLHGDPSRELAITGITGTNGKTSTAFMLYHIWSELGIPAGLIGTLGVKWRPGKTDATDATGENQTRTAKNNEIEIQTGYTTPRAGQLQDLLARMRADGVERVAMEVSSEALALGRLEGTTFRRAVFTNLTPEHLDYHGDMDAYFAAKMRLFDMTMEAGGDVVVFTAAPGGQAAAEYAREKGAEKLKTLAEPIIAAGDLAVPAFFHRINASLALEAAGLEGAQMDAARGALRDLPPIPGRYTVVRADASDTDRYGVVDYAHSPDGLENVLRACREEGVRRLVCVFGCGGDRDTSKRSLMGACAARHADLVIVTDDNPRTEDPAVIRAAIHAGIEEELNKENADSPRPAGRPTVRDIGDRRAAIQAGVEWMYDQAEIPAVVLVAGKGHESVQIIGRHREPFSDTAVLAELLTERRENLSPGVVH